MNRKNKTFSDAGSLTAVRRELRRANYADVAAVSIGLRNFWNPLALWRAGVFIFRNQRRKKLLARMDRAKMGFSWRDSRPLKLQRRLGLLPPITNE
jgi:hypothetical protein